MRLCRSQIEIINTLVPKHLGDECTVYLFGSRLNDQARGGDVDLLVESPCSASRLIKARLKAALEQELGLPIDLIIHSDSRSSSFLSLIRSEAVPLKKRRSCEFKN